jgi:hypothetical protein
MVAQISARANLASRGSGELARSVEVVDISSEKAEGFPVGTAEPAGFFVEFGTFKRAGNPWLLPALHARLPRLKHNLRTLLNDAVKSRSMGVAPGFESGAPRPHIRVNGL